MIKPIIKIIRKQFVLPVATGTDLAFFTPFLHVSLFLPALPTAPGRHFPHSVVMKAI